MKRFKIKLHPTKAKLTVIIGSYKTCSKYMKKYGVDLMDAKGVAIESNYKYFMYLNKNCINAELIAHEAVHLSWYLNKNYRFVEGGFDFKTQELQAYLVGYIIEKVIEKI